VSSHRFTVSHRISGSSNRRLSPSLQWKSRLTFLDFKCIMKIAFSFAFGLLLATTIGCFNSNPNAATSGDSSSTVSDEATPRETLNKTTQVVLDLEKAMSEGAVLADTDIPVADPLTQSAAAYRTSVGKLGGMAIDQAIQIRNAQSINDPKPLTYDQFMTEIIKKDQPDGIRLAMLPYYQEYAWDVKTQKLVVVDFPARKEERRKQLDSN
jgi:hypothetical protein